MSRMSAKRWCLPPRRPARQPARSTTSAAAARQRYANWLTAYATYLRSRSNRTGALIRRELGIPTYGAPARRASLTTWSGRRRPASTKDSVRPSPGCGRRVPHPLVGFPGGEVLPAFAGRPQAVPPRRGRTRRPLGVPPARRAARHNVGMPDRNPRLQLIAPSASPEEAAVIVAALERFMRATAQPASQPTDAPDGWRRAGVLEGVSREPEDDVPHPWINT
jgi:hypothetical protein